MLRGTHVIHFSTMRTISVKKFINSRIHKKDYFFGHFIKSDAQLTVFLNLVGGEYERKIGVK